MSAELSRTGLEPEARDVVWHTALERIRALPGVRSASTAELTPVGRSMWNDQLHIDGYEPETRQDATVWFNAVREDYHATLGTRLVAGRDFDATDGESGPKTAIVNESMAAKFFGGQSPLGRQFRTKRGDVFEDAVTIVGVVQDAKYGSLREENSATVYLPAAQATAGSTYASIVLRAAGDPLSLVPAVRQVFAEVHPAATFEATTLEAQLARSLQRERVLAVLSTLFGSVALALSMLGLYGVMAYTVARRRNEIGVRIALGADAPRVLGMVMRDVLRVILIGIVIGAVGAWGAGKLVMSFLYGLEPAEPSVLMGAVLLLLAAAFAAGLRPALRAASADPLTVLREE